MSYNSAPRGIGRGEGDGRMLPRNDQNKKNPADPKHGPVFRPPAEEKLGRLLVFVLRHHPEKVGITLDRKGSVDLETLVQALKKRPGFETVTRKTIELLAVSPISANRFEIVGDRIRATYGHSLQPGIQLEPSEPPPKLFNGTTEATAQLITKEGLKPAPKRLVHLSTHEEDAITVGLRRTQNPVIMVVDTRRAAKAGVRFYRGGPAVWLCDPIPADCITRSK
jgi:putative RNA 2'-phosphotransferase